MIKLIIICLCVTILYHWYNEFKLNYISTKNAFALKRIRDVIKEMIKSVF